MRVIRFDKGDGTYSFGVLEDDSNRVMVLADNPLYSPGKINATGQILQLDDVRLVAPVIPASKVVGVCDNYWDENETHREVSGNPPLFLKPNTSVIGPDASIILPSWSQDVHHEAELGIVIKHPAKDINPDHWKDYVFGYLVGNDLSAGDAIRSDGQLTRGKSFDTSCPLGPWITVDPDLEVQNLGVKSWVNGELRQDGTTANMIHPVGELVTFISQAMTLLPGDVILSGTPRVRGNITAGQTVVCEIEGLGRLENPVCRR